MYVIFSFGVIHVENIVRIRFAQKQKKKKKKRKPRSISPTMLSTRLLYVFRARRLATGTRRPANNCSVWLHRELIIVLCFSRVGVYNFIKNNRFIRKQCQIIIIENIRSVLLHNYPAIFIFGPYGTFLIRSARGRSFFFFLF